MSSWDTNPWSNFCDPHWELICCNKWHTGTLEIFTLLEIVVATHFHERHGTKTVLLLLCADGEASWSLLPGSIALLADDTVQPDITYFFIFKVTGQVWESQKRISINTDHSYHQHWQAVGAVRLSYPTFLLSMILIQKFILINNYTKPQTWKPTEVTLWTFKVCKSYHLGHL